MSTAPRSPCSVTNVKLHVSFGGINGNCIFAQAHSSVEKAGLIGLVKMRLLTSDEQLSLRGRTLRDAILQDKQNGLIPFYVSILLTERRGQSGKRYSRNETLSTGQANCITAQSRRTCRSPADGTAVCAAIKSAGPCWASYNRDRAARRRRFAPSPSQTVVLSRLNSPIVSINQTYPLWSG